MLVEQFSLRDGHLLRAVECCGRLQGLIVVLSGAALSTVTGDQAEGLGLISFTRRGLLHKDRVNVFNEWLRDDRSRPCRVQHKLFSGLESGCGTIFLNHLLQGDFCYRLILAAARHLLEVLEAVGRQAHAVLTRLGEVRRRLPPLARRTEGQGRGRQLAATGPSWRLLHLSQAVGAGRDLLLAQVVVAPGHRSCVSFPLRDHGLALVYFELWHHRRGFHGRHGVVVLQLVCAADADTAPS